MKKLINYLVLLLTMLPLGMAAQKNSSFEIRDGHFYRNGQITPIISGEMHYPRIPHQYWRHRLQMMKAMGLNAVTTYVFWNAHEPEPGKWNFEGDNNLAEYIKIAGEESLMVILRPGPYVCAEWEFGGYPWWLQNIEGLEIRRDNPEFLKRTKLYLDRLYQEVGSLLVSKGGPIVMVQAENEFGSYVAQRGVSVDGHDFIGIAVAHGAVAVVCETLPAELVPGVTYVVTTDSSLALGMIASNYYDHPSRALKLVGVTGTNGKTTTATLLYELVRLAGYKAGLLSTVCNYIGEEKIVSTHTTPDALTINAYMRRMVDAGCLYCFPFDSSEEDCRLGFRRGNFFQYYS